MLALGVGISLACLSSSFGSTTVKRDAAWQGGWLPSITQTTDVYGAFRGDFTLSRRAEVRFEIVGAHWFNCWLDNSYLTEGPARFPLGHAEYEVLTQTLEPGKHTLAALVTSQGVATRMLHAESLPPFFQVRVFVEGRPLWVAWHCRPMDAYQASGVRLSGQFGWIEWVDTRKIPQYWRTVGFNDRTWPRPAPTPAVTWSFKPLSTAPVRHFRLKPQLLEAGILTGPFTTSAKPNWPAEGDVDWYRRDLHPSASNPKARGTGVWRRYDLGKVRLGVPEFRLKMPAGSVVEFAYSESLTSGKIVDGYLHREVAHFDTPERRVAPYIPLSASLSRNLDHFVARGGEQVFRPLMPKGGRFVEVHVQAVPGSVKFLEESYQERSYYGAPAGAFHSDDPQLNNVWSMGIKTLRACAEDAVIDNPTRERGQWTGDALVSMQVAAAGYGDLRLFRRGLEQAAYCAQSDGLVAGLHPGGEAFLSTYSAQWVTAVLRYFQITGDRGILEELFPYAKKNVAVFQANLGSDGIKPFGWVFVDWGFPNRQEGLALSLETLEALRSMAVWCRKLHQDASPYLMSAGQLKSALDRQLNETLSTKRWEGLGYHCTVFALRDGLVPPDSVESALAILRAHISAAFPNQANAPKLADPGVSSDQIITPYFSFFAFPPLIEHGQMDFVLNQYRSCWGWALRQGLTTQPEVFDLGWSHSHVWGASPTAQLSQYVLGLTPCFGERPGLYRISLNPGSLSRVTGSVPWPGSDDKISVNWKRIGTDTILYKVVSKQELLIGEGTGDRFLKVHGSGSITLRKREGHWHLWNGA
jgi:hypothetical protein